MKEEIIELIAWGFVFLVAVFNLVIWMIIFMGANP